MKFPIFALDLQLFGSGNICEKISNPNLLLARIKEKIFKNRMQAIVDKFGSSTVITIECTW